ncbi:hypothetical protein ABZV67_39970 [Streptomyces sp. NPDC005065]|uniref:hypothetical protein n=1 Tax=Streptomyces sp. NPDC005065 TaxID=3154461 RepID=UPI0033AA6A17
MSALRPDPATERLIYTPEPAPCTGTALPVPSLTLPMPGEPYTCSMTHAPPVLAWRHDTTAEMPDSSAEERERSWYRWILGHQIAFCVWRLICDELSLIQPGIDCNGSVSASMDRVAALYDDYSALLLYSGACSPETYHSVIRHNMVSAHPAFSGTWARDYERVLALLRDRVEQRPGALRAALKTNRLVHMAVAKRLVPSDNSLLREAGAAHAPVVESDRCRLDAFFGTVRGTPCRHDLASELRCRVAAALRDLERHSLDANYGCDRIHALQGGVTAQLELLSTISAEGPQASPDQLPGNLLVAVPTPRPEAFRSLSGSDRFAPHRMGRS